MTPKLNGGSPRVTIHVTPELVAQAEQRNSSHCMIADAIRAQVPEAVNISVDLATIRWSDRAKGKRYVWLTPVICQHSLILFDQGFTQEAFSFSLRSAVQVTAIRAVVKDAEPTKANGQPRKAPKRVSTTRTVVKGTNDRGRPTIVGGKALQGTPTLRFGRGHRREFGLRTVKP